MPPLVCPSPLILDHTFPRDRESLELAAFSLGELTEHALAGRCRIVLTPVLSKFVELFDYSESRDYALLLDIVRLLEQWLLFPATRVQIVEVEEVAAFSPHPLPNGESGHFAEYWAQETGKLLVLHDATTEGQAFFIGVACEMAFSEREKGTYLNPDGQRCFPLVGPQDLSNLLDGDVWEIPSDIHQKRVSVADARKNLPFLGGEVSKRAEGSHHKVRFPNGKSWVLDVNNDPVPLRFLKQLEDIVGLPLGVLTHALLYGSLPRRCPRL